MPVQNDTADALDAQYSSDHVSADVVTLRSSIKVVNTCCSELVLYPALFVALVVYLVCMIILLVLGVLPDCFDYTRMYHMPLLISWVLAALTGGIWLFLLTRAWSPHLGKAAVLAFVNWVYVLSLVMPGVIACQCGGWSLALEAAGSWLQTGSYGLSVLSSGWLIIDRIRALETALGRNMGARRLLFIVKTFVLMFLVAALATWARLTTGWSSVSDSLFLCTSAVLLLAFATTAAAAFSKPVRILRSARAAPLHRRMRARVRGASKDVQTQLVGVSILLSISFLRFAGVVFQWFSWIDAPHWCGAHVTGGRGRGACGPGQKMGEWAPGAHPEDLLSPFWQVVIITTVACDVLGHTIGCVLLSSAFSPQSCLQQKAKVDGFHRQLRARQAAARLAWKPCPDVAWHDKVVDLAGRAVSLRALLEFYAALPSVMQHYTPGRHTTRDVVRQAIIPLSRPGTCALASVLMGGAYTRPRKMVSHSWSSLFRDLLAALVADALGEGEYSLISSLLDSNLNGVVAALNALGKLDETYWICAFSISQHHSVCSEVLPHDVDSVTLERFPCCSCSAPKYDNFAAPIAANGKSIPSEMNKFADMMAYVAATGEDFQHVIVMDATFKTFRRAWVVAEIAQGHAMGLVQHLKLRSADDIQLHEAALRYLDVNDLEASRPEDAREILASIPDKEVFNSHMRRMIFCESGGLFAVWRGEDACTKMHNVGHVVLLAGLGLESSEACESKLPGPL